MLPSISMNLVITFGKGILVYHLAAFGPGAVERFSENGVMEKVDARCIWAESGMEGIFAGTLIPQSRISKYSLLGQRSNSKKKSFH